MKNYITAIPAALNLRAPTSARMTESSTLEDSVFIAGDLRTASATPHALGAWTEEIVTTADANLIKVRLSANSTAATDTASMVSLSIGKAAAAETEDVMILAGHRGTATALQDYWLPRWVPKGTRIASAMRSLIASRTISVGLDLLHAPHLGRPPVPFIHLGFDAANSGGTPLTGATTWVEFSAACPQACSAAAVTVQGNSAVFAGNSAHNLELGIGPVGSETVIWSTRSQSATSEQAGQYFTRFGPAIVNIPKGVRIAVRGGNDFEAAIVLTPAWRI